MQQRIPAIQFLIFLELWQQSIYFEKYVWL